ncbi:hypothetical protein CDAR_164201 [Caerostris darwini]|uniref:Uncharacterized protein n=1 Tax=Caerostris darwini TaxID=1538125 RepID=A0AAV4X478_9ARAC|nr:hypothetical protein CDAR_164201 [Caerostris darwini]
MSLDPLLKEGILSPTPLSECGNFCLSDADFSVSLGRRQKCLREGIRFDLMARIKEIVTLGGGWGVLHPQFCPGLLYQENNCRSVSSTSHAPRVTDRGQPCLREEVEVVSHPKDIQWTRWTRIETGNDLMT